VDWIDANLNSSPDWGLALVFDLATGKPTVVGETLLDYPYKSLRNLPPGAAAQV
jgi:hypothetical protein